MKIVQVKTKSGRYGVICGRRTLAELQALGKLRSGGQVFALSSPTVWKLWGPAVLRKSRALAPDRLILFDDSEAAKQLGTVETICRKLAAARADRRALFVAVGGGVVGDVAGFVAASYMRGVRILHVPTTLVAQVDSAIGGKTGVNLPEGKNLIGAFYPPLMVIADPLVLRTLPPRQFRSGIYEIIKYGVIGDRALFSFLEYKLGDILRLHMGALEWIIERSIRQKARVVVKDERESGLRQILNFGHTIGHALESQTRYQYFLHGEAVAWGMLAASQIAVSVGRLAQADADRIASLIVRCGELPSLPKILPAALLDAIAVDKKSRAGKAGWVLPHRIGAADFGVNVPDAAVCVTWRELAGFYERARKAS